jgi:hypothetical protein
MPKRKKVKSSRNVVVPASSPQYAGFRCTKRMVDKTTKSKPATTQKA